MVEKNIQMQKKNTDGSFVIYYPETKAANVKAADGSNLESHLEDYESHVDSYMEHGEVASFLRSGMDSNGIFTILEWLRPLGTRFKRSVLSGGVSPKYSTRTVTYYTNDGVTIITTKLYTLTYSGDELISEVLQ